MTGNAMPDAFSPKKKIIRSCQSTRLYKSKKFLEDRLVNNEGKKFEVNFEAKSEKQTRHFDEEVGSRADAGT